MKLTDEEIIKLNVISREMTVSSGDVQMEIEKLAEVQVNKSCGGFWDTDRVQCSSAICSNR